MYRTHHCNELTDQHLGQNSVLIGWIDSIRDHGGILFLDLRDREGITQLVCDPTAPTIQSQLPLLKVESVIQVAGIVRARPEATVNQGLATGRIEVHVQTLTVHNTAQPLPFPLEEEKSEKVSEDLRFSYRYLDLRRRRNFELLRMRHRAMQCIRGFLDTQGFLEVELPTLFKSTPEGAREFLVPSRVHPGSFYALSQSPQQYKQMLMVGGIERYFSFARCYRDEDLRADRQPEFTQVDLELSFIDREDLYTLIEQLLVTLWQEVRGIPISTPFRRISYQTAMDMYGSDKPDTRLGMEINDLSDVFQSTPFKVFSDVLHSKGVIKAFKAPHLADLTQGELKHLEDIAKQAGAQGLAFIKVEKGEWKSPILKFLSEAEKAALQAAFQLRDGDMLFFAAHAWEQACTILGRVRLECAQLLKKRGLLELPADVHHFLWVVDFPLMLFDADEGRYVSVHHPFTAPVPEDVALLATHPQQVRGQHYDIVLNGMELGGGSIRIHQPEVQQKIFEEILQIPKDIVENRFGYLLEAFKFGAPPHGGIALGFDRVCAVLGGVQSIREVVAFPKNQRGQDLMAGSPASVTPKQLKELGISVTPSLKASL